MEIDESTCSNCPIAKIGSIVGKHAPLMAEGAITPDCQGCAFFQGAKVMSFASNVVMIPLRSKRMPQEPIKTWLEIGAAFLAGVSPWVVNTLRQRQKIRDEERALKQSVFQFAEGRVLKVEEELSQLRKELQTEREGRLLSDTKAHDLENQLAYANNLIADLRLELKAAQADRDQLRIQMETLSAKVGITERRGEGQS